MWGEKQQEAFETLRKRITSEPVLKQPQLEQPFEVEVDASGYAIGAVLMQCYVTVGTFTRRGLSSTAKTLRSLSGVQGSEY